MRPVSPYAPMRAECAAARREARQQVTEANAMVARAEARLAKALAALQRANERAQAVELSILRWYSTAAPQVDPV
jgi:hypothetical protein